MPVGLNGISVWFTFMAREYQIKMKQQLLLIYILVFLAWLYGVSAPYTYYYYSICHFCVWSRRNPIMHKCTSHEAKSLMKVLFNTYVKMVPGGRYILSGLIYFIWYKPTIHACWGMPCAWWPARVIWHLIKLRCQTLWQNIDYQQNCRYHNSFFPQGTDTQASLVSHSIG